MSRKSHHQNTVKKTANTVKKPARKAPSRQRVILLKVFAVLLPVLFILLFEGLLRLAGYGDNMNLFIQIPEKGYENYMMVNPEIGKKYFQKLEYTSPANDIFLKKKPENTFRIFVMGSSVVYGFPYDRNLMFSRILHKQLEDAWPDTEFEVVNTSITAINSFTLRDFAGQIMKYDPDAILIYEGHNEFYGAFGIGSNETMSRNSRLVRAHLSMLDSRFYQLLRNTITNVARKLASGRGERSQGTLMKRIVANADILYQSREYNITMKRFEQNMGAILRKAKKNSTPVFFSDLVSNVQGMRPFNSIATNSLEGADDVFARARAAEKDQDYNKALELYYKAKDLDCLRFRASEDANTVVRNLTREYDAYLVPMLSHFQENSANRFIGNNYMTEHVHPNIDGAFLMAEAFFNTIKESGLLGEPVSTPKSREYYKQNWGYTSLDSLLAHHRIQLLMGHWPFVSEENQVINYTQIYRPRNVIDSLAFTVMRNPDLSLTEVRIDLARRFEKAGMLVRAYHEYEALLRMNPYIAANYRDAASTLLLLEDLPLALNYMQRSLKYEKSFYAKFRIGEIYLIMGDYNNSIRYFEEAMDIAPEDRKVNVMGKLYNALVYANQNDRAKVFAAELERLRATQFLRIPPPTYVFDDYIPFQTEDQIAEAKQLIGQNKDQEAIRLLTNSLEIYDSHIARRLLGETYFKLKDFENANFHLSKVHDLFKFDARFLHSIIMLNLTMNKQDRAREYLEEMKSLHPGYPPLHLLTRMLI
jgi:tetratricopeptide (TPR) repeat protein